MINILHAIDTPGPGGAETVFLEIIRRLDKTRFCSYPVIPGKGYLFEELKKEGMEPIIIQSKGSFSLSYLSDLIHIVRKYKIDVIHSHLFGSNIYCSLTGLICRKPVISVFHGFVDAHVKDILLKARVALVNNGSRYTVFVSDHLKDFFVGTIGFKPEKAVTIHNGIDMSEFANTKRDPEVRKELGCDEGTVVIGAIGNIRPAKGYEYLIRAAAIVVKKIPHCRFVIAGEGSGELFHSLQILRTELGLDRYVSFIGYRKDKANLLRAFDIFVVSSLSEGFSIAAIEAMSCRIPVVATRSGGPEEIINNGQTGILVESQKPDTLANALMHLINDTNLRSLLAGNGQKAVQEKFGVSKMIESYTHLYISCVG